MAISKIYGSEIETITSVMGIPFIGWIHFIPNEFSGPLGAEWVDEPTNDGTYEVTGGQLVTTQSGTQSVFIYQTFEDPSFDIWTKFSATNTGLSGVLNRYNLGNFAIWSEEDDYPIADLYLQYNWADATEYSLAVFIDENGETSFVEDPCIPAGFDIYNPEIYLRIKYAVGDITRIYWSQGGEWEEIETGVSGVFSGKKVAALNGACYISPVNNTTSFDFIRKHDEIPFEPV